MFFTRYLIIICILIFSAPLLGQKWERLTNKFNQHYELFQYSESLDDAIKALAYATRKLDSTDIHFMLSYFNVAQAYYGLKELELAKMNIRKAYTLMVPTFTYDRDLAEVCELYGRIETELGYHTTAGELLSVAYELKIQVYGNESYEALQSLYYKADLEMASTQWDQMVNTLEEALGIHERLFSKNQDFARYANYLGLIYMNNELYQEASQNFKRALSANAETGMVKNFSYGHANNNLALIYYYHSDFENAAFHFKRADSIYQILLVEYSENYMMLLNNLASLYLSWGKADLARVAYQKLQDYLDKNPDGQDLNYIQGVENLAYYYASIKAYTFSEKYYLRAIEIRRLGSPIDSLGLARIMQSLASVYKEESRPDMAAEVAVESFNILREKLPDGNPELVSILSFLGASFFDSNQAEKAIYYYQLAIKQIELAKGDQFPIELAVYNKLGKLYHQQGRLQEAMLYLEKARQLESGDPFHQ